MEPLMRSWPFIINDALGPCSYLPILLKWRNSG